MERLTPAYLQIGYFVGLSVVFILMLVGMNAISHLDDFTLKGHDIMLHL